MEMPASSAVGGLTSPPPQICEESAAHGTLQLVLSPDLLAMSGSIEPVQDEQSARKRGGWRHGCREGGRARRQLQAAASRCSVKTLLAVALPSVLYAKGVVPLVAFARGGTKSTVNGRADMSGSGKSWTGRAGTDPQKRAQRSNDMSLDA
jgi:hypothetical protein